ncbi:MULTISPECIES: nitrous oxide reductase accessory protein NosL [Rhodanobacter]|uniref:nitrous oxide reductase accessory protein NosL n=1 Tax=Rhodanobacter TaxID=75309 RepID=UPI000411DBBD|nr:MULTISPECIES: nitrous oxide reductase accessory protein NosL [Rhodanobacter]TAN16588.1 MAG: nitrous oxide reductase [Rhodanobacter sp.]UJJ54122.1 nitrous oxide reductase accessory protein NosL [Rhodanobacter thiooxydans]
MRIRPTLRSVRPAVLALALALLAGCGGSHAPAQHAVDTHPDDACAVCGMYLDGSPGPRAEAWVSGRTKPLVFDSTRDFFAYVLQPENQSALQELYVQDSAHLDWQQPSHAAVSFIDARRAFYVAWQPLPGSMGPTLAPFATRAAAEAFVHEHGGAVLGFDEVTPAMVAALDYRCPGQAAGSLGPQQCLAPPAPSLGLSAHPQPAFPPAPQPQPAHPHPHP